MRLDGRSQRADTDSPNSVHLFAAAGPLAVRSPDNQVHLPARSSACVAGKGKGARANHDPARKRPLTVQDPVGLSASASKVAIA